MICSFRDVTETTADEHWLCKNDLLTRFHYRCLCRQPHPFFHLQAYEAEYLVLRKPRRAADSLHMKKASIDSYARESLLSSLDIQGWNLKSFAEEFYENTGQLISLAKIRLAAIDLEKKKESEDIISSSEQILARVIRNLRNLARQTTPSDILQKGFLTSLQYELDRLGALGLWSIRFSVTGRTYTTGELRELILFSIIQHYLFRALYAEKTKELDVKVSFTAHMIKISLFYRVYPELLSVEKKQDTAILLKRATHIGAVVKQTEKGGKKEISICLMQ